MPSQGDGGGGGEWQEDGSGNIVPIDGETVGDGTTTADHQSVNTVNADITGETIVKATLSADQNITSATWEKVNLDTTPKDELGEFDISQSTFSPSETGWFHVHAKISYSNDVEEDVRLRWYNVTDSASLMQTKFGESKGIATSQLVKMDSSKTYRLDARNDASSDTVNSGQTYLSIRGAFR